LKYLPKSFYQGDDVTLIARNLLGKQLITVVNGVTTGGIIVETEAYSGATDRACHAFPDKKTARTAVMYLPGGVAYVYFVYGMHHMFNVVTNVAGRADAILIRAIEPTIGLATMKARRGIDLLDYRLTGGPAKTAQALGIDLSFNREDLQGNKVAVIEGVEVAGSALAISPRIGVEYAGEDAQLLWRFYIQDNIFVSRK
jgi:DNA-3-methyladenine glycosylase